MRYRRRRTPGRIGKPFCKKDDGEFTRSIATSQTATMPKVAEPSVPGGRLPNFCLRRSKPEFPADLGGDGIWRRSHVDLERVLRRFERFKLTV